ncbi:DUF1214 domain-containing protein [Nocardia cyriacigeorgica]|jgi:hypothetical protein|uniref:DUF1214 domain-containing protein n=4 Tax=Nocardia cyriacigeorgica TaxID=135487 RepID=UPI00031F922C|nr:DUF1214 domain-containing protein [Nocardia cyriacigeorgica]AVH24071.1 DUF1254 domain-containing protein [Nocardia cyriacigeorgica]MBF6326169.1 DUF1254 domain-containing protein [Nocardia cyriacigeorgica]MBF6499137.1 DUF1254 domain-containing protein [Nocardia cyriacigeorgica]PPJ08939.1 DUF1254 domain-containing protein [Nocardia cyriacigeorgica]TLF59830.1 DUF1254 domain-containing protein [Nocardia cyriacigeorgica]
MKRRTLLSTALAAGTATAAVACVKTSAPQTGSNEPGDSAFELESINYPSADTAAELYDELDYQRAVQGYIWAQPLVGLAAMAEGARRLGIAPLELFIFNELQQVNQKLQTGNDDVVYSFAYFDLSATGPLVVDIPGGGQYGVLLDAWQRPIEDVGGTGPDGGRGGRYLVVPPGHTAPLPDTGYFVCRSKTNTGMLFLRAVRNRGENVADAAARLQKTNMFAYAEVPNPPAPRFRPMNFDDYDGLTPHGLDYFTLMAKWVAREHPEERDRIMLGMLAPLGIESGREFQPDDRTKAILVRAADTGRKMVANLEFNPRVERPSTYPATHWRSPTGLQSHTQERGPLTEIDERAALFRFGFAMQKFLHPGATPPIGSGAAYLTSFRDSSGAYLDGSKQYVLRVPPKAPILAYWSASAYDAEDFHFVTTDTRRPSISSLKNPTIHPDGTTDVHFGPKLPPGSSEQNWIKTVPGRGFLVLFRLYAPTADYYTGSWPLPDIAAL